MISMCHFENNWLTVMRYSHKRNVIRGVLILFFAVFMSGAVFSAEGTIRIGLLHDDPEPFSLVISVIEESLSSMHPEMEVELVNLGSMNQARALSQLASGQANFDIFFSGYSSEREKKLVQFDLPLTMGLLGIRVPVVRASQVEELLERVEQKGIRSLTVGSGIGWPDSKILIENNFNVMLAGYDSLWKMLQYGRVDAFARGIEEAYVEVNQRKDWPDPPVILPGYLIVYPLDYFLYTTAEKLPAISVLIDSITAALESGRVFEVLSNHKTSAEALAYLQSCECVVEELYNKSLTQRILSIDDSYWLDIARRSLEKNKKAGLPKSDSSVEKLKTSP